MNNIFSSILTNKFSVSSFFVIILFSLICGIITAFSIKIKENQDRSFLMSIIFLPPIVAMVITMVNGNIGTGIAVAGAFSLVRFRSAQGKAKEITALFMVMTAGIICASGYIAIALLFTIIMCIGIVVFKFVPLSSDKMYKLRITVPESLNINGIFDDVLTKYTNSYKLNVVKTVDFGSLFRLDYSVSIKNNSDIKNMIDEIRCLNGNLEVLISSETERIDTL